MATNKQARGTKRRCQNADCGERFYDLGRDPITCPICSAAYVIVVAAPAPSRAKPKLVAEKKPAAPKAEPEAKDEEGADLEDIEVADDTDDDDGADPTLLQVEDEEEGADVSGIVGAPAKKNEEDT